MGMTGQKRIIAKTFSWRVVASLATFLIAWIVTGKIEIGALIGGVEFFVKFILYYLHETVWEKVFPNS